MMLKFFSYDSNEFKRFLRENPYENGELEFLDSILEEGMNAIDIGGHIGVTTVAIAKRIGERGELYSFEPLPEYFDILNKNISSNGLKNVRTYQLAVTDHVGITDFYRKNASSSIVPQEGDDKVSVPTTTLDAILTEMKVERVDLINMDCEGSELFVFQGGEKILQSNKLKLFCEIHHSFLRDLHMSVRDIVEYLQALKFHDISR